MKKLLMMVLALMLAFSVSAFAAEEEEMCPECAKTKCTTPTLCEADQDICSSAQPCNVLINICNCGDGTFWKDNDYVGVRVSSLTEGVYFTTEDGIDVRLFRLKDTAQVTTTGEVYNDDWVGNILSPGAPWGYVPSLGTIQGNSSSSYPNWTNATPIKFRALGACDFLEGELNEGVLDKYPSATASEWYMTSTLNVPNFGWATTDLDYFDVDGDLIVGAGGKYSDCVVTSAGQIDMVQTKKSVPWVLDVDASLAPTGSNAWVGGDNDSDGLTGEDKGDYLVVRIPPVAVNWPEVEAAGLNGTTAQANVCILDVKGATSGLCTDCTIICCCVVDTVKLCPVKRENCIYFPYALYGLADSGWGTGIVITNTSLDDVIAKGAKDTRIAIADMSVTFTIIDQAGMVHSATFDDFGEAVQDFNVDTLVDELLALEGVAPGNLYIKAQANFSVDGYAFNLLMGDISFGSGTLARSCAWPAADVWADAYGDMASDIVKP